VRTGDRYLLCSDGLTGMLPDEELFEHFRSSGSLDATVRMLIEVANARGGVDNITAILVEVKDAGKGEAAKTDPPRSRLTSGESTAVTIDGPPPKINPADS